MVVCGAERSLKESPLTSRDYCEIKIPPALGVLLLLIGNSVENSFASHVKIFHDDLYGFAI